MHDLITTTLSRAQHRGKPLQVIKRYLQAKYRILLTDDVLANRLAQLRLR
jgi:hypothetical protein